jgi:hypothetical protein
MQPPDFDHIFQQLEVHIPVEKAFVFKQQIDETGTAIYELDVIQNIRIVVRQLFFDEAVLADLQL